VHTEENSARGWVLALASISSLMTALDTLVVSTALTTIQRDFGAAVEELEWTVNAYALVMAALLMPAAALGDRFGRRRMFGLGLALFVGASVVCALATDAVALALGRALQGAGGAFVTALAMTLVGAAYPAERRGRALGILNGITGLAVLAGPGLGGVITHSLAWEWIFWLNVPIGLVVIPLLLSKVRESRGPDTTLDGPGVVLITGAVLGVVWALARGNAAGWASAEVLGALGIGGLLLIGFVAWERRAPEPMLPLRLLRRPGFVAGNLATIGMFIKVFGGVFFFSQFLQNALGFTPLQAGFGLIPWTSTLIVLGPVAGMLADRIGNRPVIVSGLATAAVGIGWVALVAEPGMSYGQLVLPFLVASIGGSLALPPTANAVLGSVPAADVGKAAGVNTMARELGGVLGLAILVAVFATTGSYASPATFVAGFTPAIGVCAVLVACGAIAGAFVPRRRTRAGEAEAPVSVPCGATGSDAPR
jgi:EmrB/QacA subfamily drug resistance transporter